MPSDALIAIYEAHPAIRKLLDRILAAEVEDSQTTVEDLIEHCGMSRRRAVNLLRALAEAGYGEFKLGRKGRPSRFEWDEDPRTLAEQLDGLDGAEEQVDDEPRNGEPVLEMFPQARGRPVASEPARGRDSMPTETELIEHSFVLRPKLRIVVQLPEDLTAREAEVLGEWVRNLSFDR